mgnify:CR=1 FL=1
MKPRDFLNFFKTKSGKLVAFGALFTLGLMLFGTFRSRHQSQEDAIKVLPLSTNSDKPQIVQTVQRPLDILRVPALKPVVSALPTNRQPVAAVSAAPTNAPSRQIETLPAISLFADSTIGTPKPRQLSGAYAPFGRLIPCETIITVDSASIQTPIIGLITENIYYQGKLIIPAGTEAHGMAQTDRQRERIAANTSWILVWQNGKEMRLKAIVLDREFDNNTNQSGWAITDGSAGLRGEIIKSDNLAEIKLFAATFLSGAANALTEKQQTLFGPINTPSLNNAPYEGAQAVLETYARHIYDSIQKDGFYVRVPSGKQFYLYVLQTIDRADASFGGLNFADDEQSGLLTKTKP